jgi:hypothetical protein
VAGIGSFAKMAFTRHGHNVFKFGQSHLAIVMHLMQRA